MAEKVNLLTDVPYIHNTEELSEWLRPLYIIDAQLTDHDTYKIFMTKMMNILKGCFVIYECREYPIKFKFTQKDPVVHELSFRHFVIHLILWIPFVELNDLDVLDESFIMDCKNDVPKVEDYINYKLISTLRDYHIKSTTINYDISEVLYNLRNISIDYSLILGLNFSVPTFLEMYKENDEIRDIMECSFDDNMQPHEIEQKLQELQDREIGIYKDIPENPIGVILRTGTGIKTKQFAEFTISEGLKPSLEGVTIPIPIENSTMLRGLDRPSYLFIDATGARKSLVMNKKVMGKAGYFGKIVLMLARTLSMSLEVSDCGTKHLVAYEIKTKKHLQKLNGKYFKEHEDDNDLVLLNSSKRKDLIGKTIYVRSAATCALGDHVCPKCVGSTASTNIDIADGLSAFESEEVTKVINQSILSTKHLLTTNSEVIEFNPEFHDFFEILGGEITPIVNNNEKIQNINDYGIYIDSVDVVKMDEMDNDSLFNTCIANGRFYIRNIKNPSEKDILIQAADEKEIFVTELALDLMKKGKGVIRFKDLDDDDKLFEMVIMNQELTKPLYQLMDLLNKENKDDIDETIDTMSQKFLDLLIESKISANVIAAELIINRLIRSIEHMYERPDFSKEELEPYQIFTVSKALEKNSSPLVGVSFQNIKRQFLSDELFEDRSGTSYIDAFYKTEIPTDNLKKYRRLIDVSKGKEVPEV